MAANNSCTEYETRAAVFLFIKSARCYDKNQRKTVSVSVIIQ